MRTLRLHIHRGYEIKPTSNAESLRWYIQSYHPKTGIPWSEENCKQTYTLRQAIEWIDELIEAEEKCYGAR